MDKIIDRVQLAKQIAAIKCTNADQTRKLQIKLKAAHKALDEALAIAKKEMLPKDIQSCLIDSRGLTCDLYEAFRHAKEIQARAEKDAARKRKARGREAKRLICRRYDLRIKTQWPESVIGDNLDYATKLRLLLAFAEDRGYLHCLAFHYYQDNRMDVYIDHELLRQVRYLVDYAQCDWAAELEQRAERSVKEMLEASLDKIDACLRRHESNPPKMLTDNIAVLTKQRLNT